MIGSDSACQLENSTDIPGHPVAVKTVRCPFTVVVDTREQMPYAFADLWTGPYGRSSRLIVPVMREALSMGDYAIFGHPQCVIERKSKEDLYSSISQRRENFIGRLERMCREANYAAVVVEADLTEILNNPPRHTQFTPKALFRTIQAWMVRYGWVHWLFMPSREHAESVTFRLLERYWRDRQEEARTGKTWTAEILRRWDDDLVEEIVRDSQGHEDQAQRV